MTEARDVVIIAGFDPALSPEEVEGAVRARRVLVLSEGWEGAHRWQVTPFALVGPVDPLPLDVLSSWQRAGTRVLPTSETTPHSALEMALNFAITTGARDIQILGGWTPPWQDALARLLILARPAWAAARVHFRIGNEVGYIVHHGEATHVRTAPGTRIVLLPLSAKVTGITTRGLHPALRDATVDFGHVLHLSTGSDPAYVLIGGGTALLMWSYSVETRS